MKWSGEWTLPRPKHDVHLVAVATGPGVEGLYWPIAKPYQPTSPVVRKRGDRADRGGVARRRRGRQADECARVRRKGGEGGGRDWRKAVKSLAGYDEAVAAQAAGLLRAAGQYPADADVRAAARAAGDQVLRGFDAYADAWRESQMARRKSLK